MRFMMLVIPKGYEQAKPGTMPDPKAVEAAFARVASTYGGVDILVSNAGAAFQGAMIEVLWGVGLLVVLAVVSVLISVLLSAVGGG